MHLSAHPAYHQTDLLSSFRFQYHCTFTGTAHSQISRFEFFSVFHNFAHRLCVQLRRYWAVMNHAVARFAQPCQIGNFIDPFDWKLVVDVVTVFWNCYGEWSSATFALSLIPVISIFPVHEVFKVCLPALSVCIAGKGNIFRGIDGWSVTGQRFVLVSVVHIPPAAFRRVRGHLLVKRFALIPAVRDKRIGDSKPSCLCGRLQSVFSGTCIWLYCFGNSFFQTASAALFTLRSIA